MIEVFPPKLGAVVAGIRLPDSAVASQAYELACEVSDAMLFNHVVRSFLFGRLLAGPDGGRADEEVVFLSAVLHDLGLTDHARGPRRFEIEGADAARSFLLDRGYEVGRAWLVWDTIALHPWGDINMSKEPEARVTQLGIMADAVGLGLDGVDPDALAEVLHLFPRLGFKSGFSELLRREAVDKPEAHIVHPVHMMAEHCCYRVPIPDPRQMIAAAPFAD